MIKEISFKDDFTIDNTGFIVRIELEHNYNDNKIIIKKGGIVYGFKNISDGKTYGYLFITDTEMENPSIPIPLEYASLLIVMDANGGVMPVPGNNSVTHGLGYNNPIRKQIPWYTVNNKALIGKVIKINDIVTGVISCDDAYWAEYTQHEY